MKQIVSKAWLLSKKIGTAVIILTVVSCLVPFFFLALPILIPSFIFGFVFVAGLATPLGLAALGLALLRRVSPRPQVRLLAKSKSSELVQQVEGNEGNVVLGHEGPGLEIPVSVGPAEKADSPSSNSPQEGEHVEDPESRYDDTGASLSAEGAEIRTYIINGSITEGIPSVAEKDNVPLHEDEFAVPWNGGEKDKDGAVEENVSRQSLGTEEVGQIESTEAKQIEALESQNKVQSVEMGQIEAVPSEEEIQTYDSLCGITRGHAEEISQGILSSEGDQATMVMEHEVWISPASDPSRKLNENNVSLTVAIAQVVEEVPSDVIIPNSDISLKISQGTSDISGVSDALYPERDEEESMYADREESPMPYTYPVSSSPSSTSSVVGDYMSVTAEFPDEIFSDEDVFRSMPQSDVPTEDDEQFRSVFHSGIIGEESVSERREHVKSEIAAIKKVIGYEESWDGDLAEELQKVYDFLGVQLPSCRDYDEEQLFDALAVLKLVVGVK